MTVQSFFAGRLNRRNFLIAGVILSVPDLVITHYLESRGINSDIVTSVGYWAYLIFMVLANASLTIRRLHDAGRSGWYFLLVIVPVMDLVLAFYTLVTKGNPGENRYGPPPAARISFGDIVPGLSSKDKPPPPLSLTRQ